MNKKTIFLVISILIVAIVFLISCNKSKKDNSVRSADTQTVENIYLKKYSGGYMINVTGEEKGNDTEMYVLHSNGKAEWMWIEVVSGKTNILSKKTGKWDADDKSISIKIQGNTGPLKEKYTLSNNKFTNGSRYLVKTTN